MGWSFEVHNRNQNALKAAAAKQHHAASEGRSKGQSAGARAMVTVAAVLLAATWSSREQRRHSCRKPQGRASALLTRLGDAVQSRLGGLRSWLDSRRGINAGPSGGAKDSKKQAQRKRARIRKNSSSQPSQRAAQHAAEAPGSGSSAAHVASSLHLQHGAESRAAAAMPGKAESHGQSAEVAANDLEPPPSQVQLDSPSPANEPAPASESAAVAAKAAADSMAVQEAATQPSSAKPASFLDEATAPSAAATAASSEGVSQRTTEAIKTEPPAAADAQQAAPIQLPPADGPSNQPSTARAGASSEHLGDLSVGADTAALNANDAQLTEVSNTEASKAAGTSGASVDLDGDGSSSASVPAPAAAKHNDAGKSATLKAAEPADAAAKDDIAPAVDVIEKTEQQSKYLDAAPEPEPKRAPNKTGQSKAAAKRSKKKGKKGKH